MGDKRFFIITQCLKDYEKQQLKFYCLIKCYKIHTPYRGRRRTFSFIVMMVTGGSRLSSDGTGDRELDTIGELTSNLEKQFYKMKYCVDLQPCHDMVGL